MDTSVPLSRPVGVNRAQHPIASTDRHPISIQSACGVHGHEEEEHSVCGAASELRNTLEMSEIEPKSKSRVRIQYLLEERRHNVDGLDERRAPADAATAGAPDHERDLGAVLIADVKPTAQKNIRIFFGLLKLLKLDQMGG